MRRVLRPLTLAVLLSPLSCSDPTGPSMPPPEFVPSPPVMGRLTAAQYRNAVRDVLQGPQGSGPTLPQGALEPDQNPYLFYSIGAASAELSEFGTQQYADSAAAIAEAVFATGESRKAVVRCTPMQPPQGTEDPCVKETLSRLLLQLFRRPPSAADLTMWMGVVRSTAEGDVYRGLRLALYGMLQSPRFLYKIERGEPDPKNPSRRRYDSYEMAQRLSFLLWDTTPDETLLAAAEKGELLDGQSLRSHAERMLASPRARKTVHAFFDQYFNLGALSQLERDPMRYPGYTKTLASSMRTEMQLLVDDFVFRRDSDIRKIFETTRTFVNDELARLYQVEAKGASPIAFVPVELPQDGPRLGILTLGAFLSMNAHPTETSPTLRGKYLRERILCQLVPPPPGNIDLNLDGKGGMPRSLRERLEEHRKNPACSGCHAMMDPPGFLFEGFDSIGVSRTQVMGIPVVTKSEIDGVAYADARDLGRKLSTDPQVASCIVKQLYRHGNGRLDEIGDEGALYELDRRFAASGYRFRELLLSFVESEGFRTAAEVMK